MSKGTVVDQYKVGDFVIYETRIPGTKERYPSEGRIGKLHKSCSSGVAEIYPSRGGRKISRRLIHVKKGV